MNVKILTTSRKNYRILDVKHDNFVVSNLNPDLTVKLFLDIAKLGYQNPKSVK